MITINLNCSSSVRGRNHLINLKVFMQTDFILVRLLSVDFQNEKKKSDLFLLTTWNTVDITDSLAACLF